MKKLLLNTCCAPCVFPIVDSWKREEELYLFFCGPNIYPEEEYFRRLEQVRKISTLYHRSLIIDNYDHNQWLDFLKKNLSEPPESYPENGDRCLACFRYRLEKTVLYANEHHFDEFATALSISRFKNTKYINEYGQSLGEKYNVSYLPLPHDPHEAYRLGLELSKKYDVYRQKYCGCEFSL